MYVHGVKHRYSWLYVNLCVWVYVSAQWLVSRCCLVRDWPICQQEVKRSNTHLQLESESDIQREREWQRARLTGKERDGRRSSCYNKRRLIHYAKQTFQTHQQLLILSFAICCTKWFMHFRKNFSWENKVMTKEKKWETLFLLTSSNLYSSTISCLLTN